jgi:hypothetical protein
VLQDSFVEVHQQSGPELQHPHIRQHLRVVNDAQLVDALDFNHNSCGNDQVWPVFTYQVFLVVDRDANLALKR